MSIHDSSHTGISIFINKENAILSLPLISICVIYAYFKLLPVRWSISLIVVAALGTLLVQKIRKRTIQKREEKIARMDEDVLNELAAEELATEQKEEQKAFKKIRKDQEKARQRIKASSAAAAASSAKAPQVEEEEDDDFQALASYSKNKKK